MAYAPKGLFYLYCMNKVYLFFILISFSLNSRSAPVELGSYGCENFFDKFDSRMQTEYNFFFTGRASCRTDRSTYLWNLFPFRQIDSATFQLVLKIEGNNKNLDIKGRLLNGSLVSFTRVQSRRVTGADGRQWREQVYEFNGDGESGLMTRLELSFNGTERLDDFQLFLDSPFLNTSYFKMQSDDSNVLYPFSLEDVLYEQERSTTFHLEGKIDRGEEGLVYALDPGIDSQVYAECSQVSIVDTNMSLLDRPGAAYEAQCLDSNDSGGKRGLFLVRNTGSTPLGAVRFEVEMRSIPRILETAASINYNFQLMLSTGVGP